MVDFVVILIIISIYLIGLLKQDIEYEKMGNGFMDGHGFKSSNDRSGEGGI